MKFEKFLAITALLASGAASTAACSSTNNTTNNTVTGGTGGSGGGTGATGGTGGAAGGGGVAGTGTGGVAGGGGAAGSGGAAGADSGVCLGDGPADAGTEGPVVDCSTLPYGTASCPDAGTESAAPLGLDLCNFMNTSGRNEVTTAMFQCLDQITATDPCGTDHDNAVQNCIDTIFPQACQHPPMADPDGGTYDPCADVAAHCTADDAGQGGITEAQCNYALNPLTTDAMNAALACYQAGTGDCATDFVTCIGLP